MLHSSYIIHHMQCCCCCSVAKSCLTLCDPMVCSMSGFPVLHYLPEFAQFMVLESAMPSNHLILCHLLLLLPSIFPSIRFFSNESTLCMRWPKYWSFSFIIPLTFHSSDQFSSVQSLSCVQLFEIPGNTTGQASLNITNSWSLLKLISIDSVMPSNHLILSLPSPLALKLFQHRDLFQ